MREKLLNEGLLQVDDSYLCGHLEQFVDTHALISYPSSYLLLIAPQQIGQPQQIGREKPQAQHLIVEPCQLTSNNLLPDQLSRPQLILFVVVRHPLQSL